MQFWPIRGRVDGQSLFTSSTRLNWLHHQDIFFIYFSLFLLLILPSIWLSPWDTLFGPFQCPLGFHCVGVFCIVLGFIFLRIVSFRVFITPSNPTVFFILSFLFFFFFRRHRSLVTKWHENLLDTTRWKQPENYKSNKRLYAIFRISSLPCASWIAHQLIRNVFIQGYNIRFAVGQK